MTEPFLGEIAIFAFEPLPSGWAACDGQVLPIAQNQSLYSLLGTTYGGNGTTTFALPDLRGRVPVHAGAVLGGTTRVLGERAGEERHTLSEEEMPAHGHEARCRNALGDEKAPDAKVPAIDSQGLVAVYGAGATVALAADAVGPAGAGQAHENMQPFLTLKFAIALTGVFPP